jgi:hypothetical protein
MKTFVKTFGVALCALSLLGSRNTLAAGPVSQVTIGDPVFPASLPAAIPNAYNKGARDIVITPGSYLLPANGKNTIELLSWKNASLHAQGVTLIFQELHHRPIFLHQCEHVTLEGATLRFEQPAFTQGRITRMDKDEKGALLDWQIDEGYPTDLNPAKATFDVADQNTRLIRAGTGDFGANSCEPLGTGAFRLRKIYGGLGSAQVGDWLFTRISTHGNSIVQLDHCDHCAMRNLRLQNAGFAAFFETDGEGGNTYIDCKVQPGPKPKHATEPQLVGCGADGFHSVGTRTGPTLDHCAWEGLLHDDCIAIHGSLQKVESADGNKLVLEKGNRGGFAVGEPVRISSKTGFFAQFNCIAMRTLEGGRLELTLDRDSGAPADSKASNPMHDGANFKIIHCTLGNCRSRGILVKADHGLIEDCTISGCGMSAVSIGPEYYWGEADYCWDVIVRGNKLASNVLNGSSAGVVFVHGDGAIGNRNITIADNLFDRNYSQIGIHVEDTDGVQITGNTFVTSAIALPGKSRTVVDLQSSKDIQLNGNRVQGAGTGDILAHVGKDVADMVGNDAGGIESSKTSQP